MKLGYYALSDPTQPVAERRSGHAGQPRVLARISRDARSVFHRGAGIARQRDLGLIDMRQIAPTVAQLLGVRLPKASQSPLAVHQ